MDFIRSTALPAVKRVRSRLAKYGIMMKLRQIQAIKKPGADKIGTAIKDALNINLNTEERLWIERIEEVRNALIASDTEIIITDYGAGEPELNRTAEEMYQGVEETTHVSDVCNIASLPYLWALILFKIVREFKPSTCIELGTSLGISAAYQAAAQKINNNGTITTLEGAASLAALSEQNLQRLGLNNAVVVRGRFQDNLDKVLNENQPIDYAFIDGHHDEKATLSYFESFMPHLSKKAVLVFDDISWSDGMRRAWDTIVENKDVKLALDLKQIGICLLDDDMDTRFRFKCHLLGYLQFNQPRSFAKP